MKKLVLAALLTACGAVFAQTVDTNVPGVFQVDVLDPLGLQPGTWPYDVTVNVVVADQAGVTGTQATINVNGAVVISACSGRGCSSATRVNNPLSVTLTAADGTQPVSFTGTTHTQTTGLHQQWTTWVPSGAVPIGTYTLHVTGQASCLHVPLCTWIAPGTQGAASLKIASTTVSVALPATFWWTQSLDAQFQADLGLTQDYTVISTQAGNTTGPQRVCDLYDQQVTSGIVAFFNVLSPGTYQVDGTTSSASNVGGSWVCSYTVSYQDVINNPGIEEQFQTAQGVVTVGSGPDSSGAPQPPAPTVTSAAVKRHDD